MPNDVHQGQGARTLSFQHSLRGGGLAAFTLPGRGLRAKAAGFGAGAGASAGTGAGVSVTDSDMGAAAGGEPDTGETNTAR